MGGRRSSEAVVASALAHVDVVIAALTRDVIVAVVIRVVIGGVIVMPVVAFGAALVSVEATAGPGGVVLGLVTGLSQAVDEL